MTENGSHNLEHLRQALQEMGFSSIQELHDHMSQFENSKRMDMIEREKNEAKRILLISATRYLGMGSDGRGK